MAILALNSKNQFRGQIQRIIRGPVVCEVEVFTPTGGVGG